MLINVAALLKLRLIAHEKKVEKWKKCYQKQKILLLSSGVSSRLKKITSIAFVDI